MNRYQHPSERSLDFQAPAASRLAQSRLIESACRCYCFSSSKASTATTDERVAATDQAVVTQLELGKNAKLQTGGLQTGNVAAGGKVGTAEILDSVIAGGDVLTTNLDLAGARIGDDNSSQLDFAGARIGDDVDNSSNLAGSRIGSSEIGSITITDTGGEILTQALDRVTQFATLAESGRETSLAGILGLAQRSEQNRADADANTGDTLAALLDATTAAKTAVDPEAQKNQTILWIVMAVLAYLFFRRT